MLLVEHKELYFCVCPAVRLIFVTISGYEIGKKIRKGMCGFIPILALALTFIYCTIYTIAELVRDTSDHLGGPSRGPKFDWRHSCNVQCNQDTYRQAQSLRIGEFVVILNVTTSMY